jgi:glyoxylase-like metal-dependent hydrolase (beta-lactamase superfamily II)
VRDGFASEGRFAGELTYPLAESPAHGGAVEIAPGVLWMRMPLGGSLQFINVWALADEDGWTVIDTGMQGEDTTETWRKVFAGPLAGKAVKRVMVTHMHPDHIGMAGWITRKFRCRLWITRTEYVMCRMLAGDTGREAPEDGVEFYRAAGWDQDALDTYLARFGGFGRGMHALPDSFRRISDGQSVMIGGREWRVVIGSGHTPEHACFYCPELKLFISGDQVLPKITSNVSVFPTEPDGNPLEDWITSLARIRSIVPDDVLVLPAHNEPFLGLHARINDLIGYHEDALQRLEAEIVEPKRAVDVFGVLFKRKIDNQVLSMATGESLAHLNWLTAHGRAVRERDAAGVDWFRATIGA